MAIRRVPYDDAVRIVVSPGDGTDVRGAYAVLRPDVGIIDSMDVDAAAAALITAGAIAVRTDVRREVVGVEKGVAIRVIENPVDALVERLSGLLDGDELDSAIRLAIETFGSGYGRGSGCDGSR